MQPAISSFVPSSVATPASGLCREDAALCDLGWQLRERGYHFVTVTPTTHARIARRAGRRIAHDLRDVFGWNRPFAPSLLPREMFATMRDAEILERQEGLYRSTVRFSTLGGGLYLHSAFPTTQPDAVFFGPDTYRFARLIAQVLGERRRPVRTLLDIGAGSGAGGLSAAERLDGSLRRLVLGDVNAKALRYARINAVLAGQPEAEICESDVVAGIYGRFDMILCNPPYLMDSLARAYRHGGDGLGRELSLRVLREAIPRLAPGGHLVLYTGAAIIDGRDELRSAAEAIVARAGLRCRYEEIDPDVFGEELDNQPYAAADRIAAVAVVVHAPATG